MHLCTLQHRITKMLGGCAIVVMLRLNGFCMFLYQFENGTEVGTTIAWGFGLSQNSYYIRKKTLGA